jgi:branched-chain amino acid transport system ATP-binding protein
MSSLLEVNELSVHHGQLEAVRDVSLSVGQGEVLGIIGANGAGKSTLLRTIAGLHRPSNGAIRFDGVDITHLPPEKRVALGVVLVPEGRHLFGSLNVEENLLAGRYRARPGPWTMDRVLAMFPWMEARRRQPASQLSGGEQQAVAISRALLANPRLLMLDEPSLGLAPLPLQRIYAVLPELVESGIGVLLVEQDVRQALKVSGRIQCLLEGRQTLAGVPAQLDFKQIEEQGGVKAQRPEGANKFATAIGRKRTVVT